jgi:hypothetical protein
MIAEQLIDDLLDGQSVCSLIQEKIDPGHRKAIERLKPNTRVRVFHGTSKVYLPQMINGFDAVTQEMARHYGGPRHVGLFVSPDIDVASRFSSYGEVVLDIEVKAKNLHGTDYSGSIAGKKEDEAWKDKYPSSFRPGLSYSMLAPGAEPQALLLGMVGPSQIKRIRWKEGIHEKPKWYTRSELLKKNITIQGSPGSGYGEQPLEDMALNLSSTRTNVKQLFKAIAANMGKGYTVERVEGVFKAHARRGKDSLYEMLRYTFNFGEKAAKVLSSKLIKYFK